ncbi:hypothetical protein EV177_001912 [Coemansia sp. RSA 1804]|nr:hypothetical protein EV177_001912 [Coemansia sp. RSA 1804]
MEISPPTNTNTNNYRPVLLKDPLEMENNPYTQHNRIVTKSERSSATTTNSNCKGLSANPEQNFYTAQSSARCLDSHASLAELEMRLRSLQQQMGICDSSKTLEESPAIEALLRTPSSDNEQHAAWFDLCGWIRRPKNAVTVSPALSATAINGNNRKPHVLYRRSKSHVSEKPSNIGQLGQEDTFKSRPSDATIQPKKPNCPDEIAKLLDEFSGNCGLIASFMNKNEALMEPLMPYVLEDAHFMSSRPGIVLLSDPTSQHLPPLAAEEYAAHISRITYFVRALQALEAADPGYLSNPYSRLLLDLLIDLEHAITLPRIEFLRRHAETVHAMGAASAQQNEQKSSSVLAIGNGDEWIDPDSEWNVQHMLRVAQAIPRRPSYHNSNEEISRLNKRMAIVDSPPALSTCEGSILGDRLWPDSNLPPDGVIETSKDPLIAPINEVVDQISNSKASTRTEESSTTASTAESNAEQFHSKLHPVVKPRLMEVSTRHQMVANSRNVNKGKRPGRLYRKSVLPSAVQSVM